MASAWLIRRFIDPKATFGFVERPADSDVPFDMYTGEFSHQGTACTFETLTQRFNIADAASAAPRQDSDHRANRQIDEQRRPNEDVSDGVGGEFPIVLHEQPNEVELWSIGPAPTPSCASTRVHPTREHTAALNRLIPRNLLSCFGRVHRAHTHAAIGV